MLMFWPNLEWWNSPLVNSFILLSKKLRITFILLLLPFVIIFAVFVAMVMSLGFLQPFVDTLSLKTVAFKIIRVEFTRVFQQQLQLRLKIDKSVTRPRSGERLGKITSK